MYFCETVAKGKFKRFTLEGLEITGITAEGMAVGRHEGLVVFVKGAVPGDRADVLITRKKKNFLEGEVARIVESSPDRVVPACEHFGVCGGCKWQHLSYPAQLNYKNQQVTDAMTRIGHVEVGTYLPILGNKSPYFYRNKLEFTASDRRWLTVEEISDRENILMQNALGFHIPGMFDKVLDITNCHLQTEPSNVIRLAVKKYLLDHGLTFFNIRNQHGFLRTLMIRTTSTGEIMVLVAVFENDLEALNGLLNHLKANFPQITALLYTHNGKKNDTLEGLEIKVFDGQPFITEKMEGLSFRISAKSFYQTNSIQAYELYKITRDYCGLTGTETVYDLYTGTGTIANFVARQARKVIGVEYVEDAVIDARRNSELNQIGNTTFFAGDMKDVLNDAFLQEHGQPDVIITDPPRAGMHEDVVRVMMKANPEKIVYVSCNPATQARDLALLSEQYTVVKMQPVDMFPQTTHVENVALLVRK